MEFNDRPFHVYAILCDPLSPPIWKSTQWARTAALMDPLVAAARDRAAVRSLQFRRGEGSPNVRAIPFGRIGWNANGHRKWVHPEPDGGETPEFLSTEVWAPSWTAVQKERRAPDLYFGFRNEAFWRRTALAFNPFIVLAVAADQSAEICALGRACAEALADQGGAILRAYRRRNRGYRLDHEERENAIGDSLVTAPFRPGKVHERPMSLEIFQRRWRSF